MSNVMFHLPSVYINCLLYCQCRCIIVQKILKPKWLICVASFQYSRDNFIGVVLYTGSPDRTVVGVGNVGGRLITTNCTKRDMTNMSTLYQ